MAKQSAGILLHRRGGKGPELFLVHPGGPFWKNKDDGAWTIPKGAVEADEEPLAAALREFGEETGFEVAGPFRELGTFRQPGGKIVHAWATEGDADPKALKSNLFEMEWPPRSGRRASFPEIDRAGWFDPEAARRKILKGQKPIIEALLQRLSGAAPGQETT
jgi:predicted NUDIX family NTP pyrophosphohydrolase